MAVTYFLSAPILMLNPSSSKRERPAHRILVRASSTRRPIRIGSDSNVKLKVFEDRSTGIVCYRDEKGEITCEGYDEGPRFLQQFPCNFAYSSRNEEIIEFLQRCLASYG